MTDALPPETAPETAPETSSDGSPEGADEVVVLRGGGVCVVVALSATALPEVLHWGRDVGPVASTDLAALRRSLTRQVSPSALDAPWPLTILPAEPDGWQGRPGIAGTVDAHPILPVWTGIEHEVDASGLRVRAATAQLSLASDLRLDDAGVLRVTHSVTNTGDAVVELAALEATMPFGRAATEVLDFGGRWTRERVPQRAPLSQGSRVRESRRGRTGHDAPTLLAVGSPGFDSSHGELWAVHLAWSADSVYRVDDLPESVGVIGAGELLRAGEIRLAPGEAFTTPDAVFVFSDSGLDGLSHRLHRSLRARPGHPHSPRPVILNTWEAVYFDHDLAKLTALADTAAAIGVERFVLDDGWFAGRRADDAGLGDWRVDRDVWPAGLHPLVDHVRGLGLEFGLWFEPEMVNLDSELARRHRDWVLEPIGREARSWRNQHVLDVARPEVAEHLLESISALVDEYRIDYIKWDQNRDLLEAVHAGRAGVDAHTRAVYRLIDDLRARHPRLEIESCASGGGRVDLGILARTDRVWASDTNDPVERLAIQRWTELLLPLELIGSHVGGPRSHTTGRVADLDFRLATALFAHAGIEWNITECTPDELDRLRAWIALYQRVRPLLHSGRLMHPESADAGAEVTAVVADDRAHALVRLARTATADRALPPTLALPGLDPDRRYRVAPIEGLGLPHTLDAIRPPWLDAGEIVLPGSLLAEVGVRVPLLGPAQALVLEVTAVD